MMSISPYQWIFYQIYEDSNFLQEKTRNEFKVDGDMIWLTSEGKQARAPDDSSSRWFYIFFSVYLQRSGWVSRHALLIHGLLFYIAVSILISRMVWTSCQSGRSRSKINKNGDSKKDYAFGA